MNTGLSIGRRPAPPGARVLALTGHADLDTAPALARALRQALTSSPVPETLVVDCSQLSFCSSSGLNELLRARRAAAERGIAFCLGAPSRQVSRLLGATDTDTVFDITTSTPPITPSTWPHERRGTDPHGTGFRTRPGRGMRAKAAALAAEAERQIREGQWEVTPEDAALAGETADRLAQAVGPAAAQAALPTIERLELLRETLAHLTAGIARTHGQLAWFLAQGTASLTPVLQWRTLLADHRQSFGTRLPTPDELTDAEDTVRSLRTALTVLALPTPGSDERRRRQRRDDGDTTHDVTADAAHSAPGQNGSRTDTAAQETDPRR
ncbi:MULTISPECIES: STAS domain-containing protein [Kitasatospora]|uniref:Anti-anti-sigma factor n=2 Tax=Kitasatospora TaxID=2063 RepID=A0ABT1J288_9ACTN|nr:STAS domain-containing protein [Kitasatospora paracochleata]MCP2311555.1 anti-anti-sigma factor [Kitasatospora paracochleata]